MGSLSIMSTPHCLISTEQDGHLHVHDEVLQQVHKLNGPLVVVAIAGLYRTGKSYLLNRLVSLKSTKGFSLGSSIVSHTKGIWLWVRPHPTRKGHYLLLLDTEGLGDVHKGDPNHDNWIFCLATLLSSVLCLNTKGVIDDNALRKLNFITELCNHLRISSVEDAQMEEVDRDGEDYTRFLPDFVYVLRDFHLQIEKDGREMTADEYLEDCLALRPEKSEKDKEFNFPRKCILKFFKRRRCFTFDFPVTSRQKMKGLDDLPDTELSEDFLEDTKLFCEYIHQQAQAKTMDDGQPIQGRMWATLVSTYVSAINAGKVPDVEDAVATMAIVENTRIITHCLTMYKRFMNLDISLPTQDEQTLTNHHLSSFNKVLVEFMAKAVFDKDSKYQNQLHDQVKSCYAEYVQKNEELSESISRSVLRVLQVPYEQKQAKGRYSCSGGYAKFRADVDTMQTKYNARMDLGVKKNAVLLSFMESKWDEGEKIMTLDNAVTKQEQEVERHRQATLASDRQRAATEAAKIQAEQQAQLREQSLRDATVQMEKHMTQMIQEQKLQCQQQLDQQLSAQAGQLQSGFSQQRASLQDTINQLQQRR